jgi:hypothetical protein
VLTLDPKRLIFADEKLLKGQELFTRTVRVDPMTGEKPAMNPDPDFRNTHSITADSALFLVIDQQCSFKFTKETMMQDNFHMMWSMLLFVVIFVLGN